MLKKSKLDLSKVAQTLRSVFEADERPMPRTAEHLKEVYSGRTEKFLKEDQKLILEKGQVRFIALRSYALNATGKFVKDDKKAEPHVVNVEVDPDFNPHVLNVVDGKLVGNVATGNIIAAKTGWLSVEEFLEYFKIGAFVFVDFGK